VLLQPLPERLREPTIEIAHAAQPCTNLDAGHRTSALAIEPLPLVAEGVAKSPPSDGASGKWRLVTGDRRAAAGVLTASGGGEVVSVELEEVVGGGQQPPFGSDG
jgi:hypothetical protein